MDDVFQATHLRPHEARQAYPLVRTFVPAISLDKWLVFAYRLTRTPQRRGGLVAVKDVRGYVHALFSYRIEIDLCHGRSMRASDVIVGDLPGKAIRTALVRAIDQLADGTGCSSVVIELAQAAAETSDVATRSAFASAGFTPCAVSFLRQEPPYLRPPAALSALPLD